MEEPQLHHHHHHHQHLQITDTRDSRIIAKIRDLLSSQNPSINPTLIERQIQQLFPSFETPTHPPYALMIQKAVKGLNERNGSTQEAISGFIKKEFQDLPLAHSRILGVHMGKLCEDGEIFRNASGRYVLADDCDMSGEMKEKECRRGRRRKKGKRGRNHRCDDVNDRQNEEEQNHISELPHEPIEEQGNSEIGHGQVVQRQCETQTPPNDNTDQPIQEANMEVNDNISLGEIMNMKPCMAEKQNSMVIKYHVPCEKQPDNLTGGETLERTGGAESCNKLEEHKNEEQNHLSEIHGKGTDDVIEEQGKYEVGQLGVIEECHGHVVQGQGEVEIRQNENTEECEKQIEATTKRSSFCSYGMSNNENLSASLGSLTIAENQCEKQPVNLLAEVENQSLQTEATNEMSRFSSYGIGNNEYLSASPGNPTVSVFPKEKLQISEQEQHQGIFSDACGLLVDQEGPVFHMETPCSSLPTAPDLPVDLTSHSQNFMAAPISTEFLEHITSEGIELTPTQLLVQTSCGAVEIDLHTATKTLASMTIHGYKQPQDDILGSPEWRVEENTTFGDLEKHMPMPLCIGLQPNEKSFADYREVSLLPSDGGIVDRQKPKGRGRGRGRGRPSKLKRNPHQHKDQLQLQGQTLPSVSFPSLEPDETIYASPAPDLPASPNQLQLVDPTYEKAIVELELRMAWERLNNGDSLSSLNGSEDKPQQHGSKVGAKRKLHVDSKKEIRHPQRKLPKRRCRGRPPNPVPTHDSSWSWVPVESSNNGIHGEENPNFSNTVKPRKLQSRESFEHHCKSQDSSWSWVPVDSSNNGIHSEENPNFSNTVKPRKLQSPESFERHCKSQDSSWSWVPVDSSNNGIRSEENPNFSNTVKPRKLQSPESFERHCKSQDSSWSWVPVESSNNGIQSEENPNFSNTWKPRKSQSPKSFERHYKCQDSSWSWVPVDSSNNGIHSEKNPNFSNTVKPRKLQSPESFEHHCESWQQDQAQQVQVHSPKSANDNDPSWEQTQMILPPSVNEVLSRELLHLDLSNSYQNNQQLSLETC